MKVAAKHALVAIAPPTRSPASVRSTPTPPNPLTTHRPAAVSSAQGGVQNLGGANKTPHPSPGTGALNGTADHPQRPRPHHAPAPTGTADHPHIPTPGKLTKKLEASRSTPASGTSGGATPALRQLHSNGPTATPGVLPSRPVHHDHGPRVWPELPHGRPPKRVDTTTQPAPTQGTGFSWSDLANRRGGVSAPIQRGSDVG